MSVRNLLSLELAQFWLHMCSFSKENLKVLGMYRIQIWLIIYFVLYIYTYMVSSAWQCTGTFFGHCFRAFGKTRDPCVIPSTLLPWFSANWPFFFLKLKMQWKGWDSRLFHQSNRLWWENWRRYVKKSFPGHSICCTSNVNDVQRRAGTILSDGTNKYFLSLLCGFSWPQFGNLIATLCTYIHTYIHTYCGV
jgi:hypothetical protein